jgi:hypothetical protein
MAMYGSKKTIKKAMNKGKKKGGNVKKGKYCS